MTDPTGSRPSDQANQPDQTEQPYRRRRSPYATKLWERPSLDTVLPEPPSPRPNILVFVLLLAGLLLMWGLFHFILVEEPAPPESPPPQVAAPGPVRPVEEPQAPPIYRPLTREEMLDQMPPGATITE